jgi:hypothetical protein
MPLLTSCARQVICGKILDADTNKPISDVVIIGTWYKPGYQSSYFYKSSEVTSDAKGAFCLTNGDIFQNYPWLVIFKSGYSFLAMYDFEIRQSITKGRYKDILKWDMDKATVYLQQLPVEERAKNDIYEASRLVEHPHNEEEARMSNRTLFDAEFEKERTEVNVYRKKQISRRVPKFSKPSSDATPIISPSDIYDADE